MGTITINVKDDVEKEFRETIKNKLGEGKGILGKAVEEAIRKWVEEERQRKIADRGIELTNKGLYSLKGWKFKRDDIYERRL